MQRHPARANILHLIDVADTGGAETVFCQLTRHFGARSENALIVLPAPGWIAEQLSDLGTPIVYLASKGSVSLRLLWKLGILAIQSKANVFVTHLLGSAVYASLLGLLLRRPVIAIFHGALDFREPGRFASIKRWLLGLSHVRIVAVSSGVKDALAAWGICEARVQVIENGVDANTYRRIESRRLHHDLKIPPSARVVGAVGNLHPVKGYETMIRAAALVAEQNSNVIFVVAGDGEAAYRKELEALRDDLVLGDRFRFLGFRAAGPELYSEFDLLLSAASSEGLPLSFLEAMSCGVPIVATSNEGSTRLLHKTMCGLLVPEATPRCVAETVLRVLRDGSLAADLGRSGRWAVLESYSLAITLGRYERLVNEAVSSAT